MDVKVRGHGQDAYGYVTQNRDKRRVLVKEVIKLWDAQNKGNFLRNEGEGLSLPINFSNTLLHGVG